MIVYRLGEFCFSSFVFPLLADAFVPSLVEVGQVVLEMLTFKRRLLYFFSFEKRCVSTHEQIGNPEDYLCQVGLGWFLVSDEENTQGIH